MKKKFLLGVLAAGFVAVGMIGCKKDDETPAQARVLVTHASPDAPGVDLLVDDTRVNTAPLTFPNNTGYLPVNAGTRNIKVNAAGTSTTVINANLNLEAGKNYSVFAVNRLANLEAVVLQDDLTTPATGQAHVRVVHLSPDAPAVNIGVQGSSANLFSNIVFKGSTAFTPVAAGSYNLEVRVASNGAVALTVPATLEAGKIYTVFARGFLAPPTGNTNALAASVIVNN
ncbi:MAG: DUF4397 domain-containing protein [Hydrotalea sp.]|nr:DUF4397 domain-containing protein [Hydrotalea sp.]